jgi:hypothetical protein
MCIQCNLVGYLETKCHDIHEDVVWSPFSPFNFITNYMHAFIYIGVHAVK